MPDNLPEHGAGAQPSHDPQEERRWTGTVVISKCVPIGFNDGCFTEEQAKEFAFDLIDLDDCFPNFRAWA